MAELEQETAGQEQQETASMDWIEQEVASAAKFILEAVGNATPYYWEVPQNFIVPAVYFPAPGIVMAGDATDTYRVSYSWIIKFFARTTEYAQYMARKAATAIKDAHNCIPLVSANGEKAAIVDKYEPVEGAGTRYYNFRVRDPEIRETERGVWQMTLSWNSPRYYTAAQADRAMRFIAMRGDDEPFMPPFPYEEGDEEEDNE